MPQVVDAARQDDPDALALLQARTGYYLGVGVVTLIHLFNPELICIGGGVAKAGDLIMAPLIATVDRLALPAMRERRVDYPGPVWRPGRRPGRGGAGPLTAPRQCYLAGACVTYIPTARPKPAATRRSGRRLP